MQSITMLFLWQALEKFSTNTHEVSAQLHDFTQRLQEAGFPNDVTSTKDLLLGQVS